MGMENAAAMLENRLTVPQALQDKIPIGPNNIGSYIQEKQKHMFTKNLCS